MTFVDPKDMRSLRDLILTLKASGVRVFRHGDLHIEFAAPQPEAPPEQKPVPQEGPPEQCKCGHAVYEHMSGVCLHCPPEKCAVPAS